MSDPYDPRFYALSDDELEALLDGHGPSDSLGPLGNPVAGFLDEVRGLRHATGHPRPDPRLGSLFAGSLLAGSAPHASNGTPPPIAHPTGELHVDSYQWSDGHQPPQLLTRTEVYRSSPIHALARLLQPSATKLLVGATTLLAVVAVAQAAGLFDLPFAGSTVGDEQVIAANQATTSSVEATIEVTTTLAATPTFGAGEATAPPPPSETTTTAPPATKPPPTEPPATTPEQPTTVTETAVEEPTSAPPPSTPSTLVPNLDLVPGLVYLVPAQVPAGSYRAPTDGACQVTITHPGGAVETAEAGPGGMIRFTLIAGDTVQASDGCPPFNALGATAEG